MIPASLEAAMNGWHVAARLRSVVDGARHDVLNTLPTPDNLADILGTVLLRLEAIAVDLDAVEVVL